MSNYPSEDSKGKLKGVTTHPNPNRTVAKNSPMGSRLDNYSNLKNLDVDLHGIAPKQKNPPEHKDDEASSEYSRNSILMGS